MGDVLFKVIVLQNLLQCNHGRGTHGGRTVVAVLSLAVSATTSTSSLKGLPLCEGSWVIFSLVIDRKAAVTV